MTVDPQRDCSLKITDKRTIKVDRYDGLGLELHRL